MGSVNRLFIALVPPAEMVEGLYNQLAQTTTQIDLIPYSQYHVSLCFLGETPSEEMVDVIEDFNQINFYEFDVSFKGIDAFHQGDKISSLHMRINNGLEDLVKLHDLIAGKFETRRDKTYPVYSPHLNISRNLSANQLEVRNLISRPPSIPEVMYRALDLQLLNSSDIIKTHRYECISKVRLSPTN